MNWFTNFVGSAFGGWLSSPWLFLGGALLVASPIIIHLLNKRRFKIVDWAAMTFLLDANVRNRRRIRIENLILLALRCLAVLLIAFLVARPFIPTGITGGLLDAIEFERVVVLDDSLSMQARIGNQTAFDEARQDVIKLVESLAADQTDDALTLILTSRPDQPVVSGTRVSQESVQELVQILDDLQPSDRSAHFETALQEVERHVATQPRNINRVVYVFTDMRQRDWDPNLEKALVTGKTLAESAEQAQNHPAKVLGRLSQTTNGCLLVDVGEDQQSNLVVTDIRPEATLVAGVLSAFEITVANLGEQEARNVQLRFTAGQSLPVTASIESIPPGKTEKTTISYTFALDREAGAEPDGEPGGQANEQGDGQTPLESVKVRAEVEADGGFNQDRLEADSSRYFAARVIPGIPTLIVDGDPSAVYGQAESFYLQRALTPPGQARSGIVSEVVTETQLETLSLDKYQVIILCNVFQLTNQRIAALEQWTRSGGGLVIMPGDHVDEIFYNKVLYQEGQGLLPLRLETPDGDEEEQRWVFLRVTAANHEVMQQFAGQNNPLLSQVKVFRWWKASRAKDPAAGEARQNSAPNSENTPGGSSDVVASGSAADSVAIPVRFTDPDESPAMAEKQFGKGRVLMLTIPADREWTDWPDDPSYLICVQELVRYMAGNTAGRGDVRVGDSIRQPLDLTRYQRDAVMVGPGEKKANVQALPEDQPADNELQNGGEKKANPQITAASFQSGQQPDSANADNQPTPPTTNGAPATNEALWTIKYGDTNRRGFYELQMSSRTEDTVERVLFAANVDPSEGDLTRVNKNVLEREFRGLPIRLVSRNQAATQGLVGSKVEIWKWVIGLLVAVLFTEQLLGWLFGRNR